MDNKTFITYVRDQMRMGLDHGQIAKKLGIDISEIKRRCDEADGKIVKPVESAKPKEKPVSGASVATKKNDIPVEEAAPETSVEEA